MRRKITAATTIIRQVTIDGVLDWEETEIKATAFITKDEDGLYFEEIRLFCAEDGRKVRLVGPDERIRIEEALTDAYDNLDSDEEFEEEEELAA